MLGAGGAAPHTDGGCVSRHPKTPAFAVVHWRGPRWWLMVQGLHSAGAGHKPRHRANWEHSAEHAVEQGQGDSSMIRYGTSRSGLRAGRLTSLGATLPAYPEPENAARPPFRTGSHPAQALGIGSAEAPAHNNRYPLAMLAVPVLLSRPDGCGSPAAFGHMDSLGWSFADCVCFLCRSPMPLDVMAAARFRIPDGRVQRSCAGVSILPLSPVKRHLLAKGGRLCPCTFQSSDLKVASSCLFVLERSCVRRSNLPMSARVF